MNSRGRSDFDPEMILKPLTGPMGRRIMTARLTRNYRPWNDYVQEAIKDPELAAEYLTAAARDEDSKAFVIALKNIIDVYGGLSRLARKAKLNRGNLHKALTGKGDIKFDTLQKTISAAGFEFRITVLPSAKKHSVSAGASSRSKKIAKKA